MPCPFCLRAGLADVASLCDKRGRNVVENESECIRDASFRPQESLPKANLCLISVVFV